MKRNNKNEPEAKPVKKGPLIAIGAFILMAGIVWVSIEYNRRMPPPDSSSTPTAAPLPSLIATLAPDLFTGKAREAYQVAKEIPEILQHMPCFCGCFSGFGHKNNLYCFADDHGKVCDECQEIALQSKKLHDEGMTVEKIAQAIRDRWGH